MSRSPLDFEVEGPAFDAYRTSWSALNKLLRRGYSWSGHERNCAFLNLGGEAFANVSAVTGFDFPDDARALARCDWDGDGDQDLFVTNRTSPRVRFLRNDQTTSNDSVSLELRGTRSNRDAIGARVELTFESGGRERRLVRGVRAGEGYLAQSSSRLTIGLGAGPVEILAVSVSWPGGEREGFQGVKPGRAWRLVEGVGQAEAVVLPVVKPKQPSTLPSKPVASPSTTSARVPLVRPVPMPRLDLEAEGGVFSLFGLKAGGEGTGTGKAVLLLLFSRTCAPCAVELDDLVQHADELERAGLAPLALAVEGEGAASFLEERGWPFPWAIATSQAIELLEALQGILLDRERRLGLPASFLVDSAGSLRVMYPGPVSAEQLLLDLPLCDLGEGALFDAVAPFPGRWMFPGLPNDADFFEGRLRARGLEEAAREFARGRLSVVRSSPADLLQEFGRRSAVDGKMAEAEGFFARALAADPRHFGALFDWAVVLHRQERLSEAIELYGKALALKPDHADARFNLALAGFAQGDREGAERQLRWLKAHGEASAAILEEVLGVTSVPR